MYLDKSKCQSETNKQAGFIYISASLYNTKTGHTYRLGLPASLDNSLPTAILGKGLDIIAEAKRQAAQAQQPEDYAERSGHAQLKGGGGGLEVEADHDGDANDGHVDAEAQVGEECAFVRAVVARVAVGVVEEEGPEEGRYAEDGAVVMPVRYCIVRMNDGIMAVARS